MVGIHLRSTYLTAPVLALVSVLLTAAVAVWLPLEVVISLMREGGPVENATALLYLFAAGAVFLVRNPAFGGVAKTASAFVLLCCIAREVSVRRWLLDEPLGVYCCTPAQTRVILGVLLVLLVISGVWLVTRYGRALLTAFSQRVPAAMALMTMLTCAVLSQMLDRVPKFLAAFFGHAVSMRGRALALSLEEVLEMMLPALVILAVVQARGEAKAQGALPDAQAPA